MNLEDVAHYEKYARDNLERIEAQRVKMSVGKKQGDGPYTGIVPELCKMVLELATAVRAKGKGASR